MVGLNNVAWHLVARPTGEVSADLFEVREGAVPVPGPGEVLVRNIYLFVPASMRLWMNERPSRCVSRTESSSIWGSSK